MSKLEKFKEGMYLLPKEGNMLVPGLVIALEKFLDDPEIKEPLEQVKNVAHLPGIKGYSIAMADIHWGYGFPIGGVAAMDAQDGVISPGGVGYDINCGVRLAILDIKFSDFDQRDKTKLLQSIYHNVPSGVGHGRGKDTQELSHADYKHIIDKGVLWAIEKGYGFKEDIDHCESKGKIEGAHIEACSSYAKERGKKQHGSLGSGNHFIEIGEIQKTLLPDIASSWQVEEGSTYVLIHSGSRGFGHQVCQDHLDAFMQKGYAKGLPDKQLVAAPIQSEAGQNYYAAMAAAANFAFVNRQILLHLVRREIKKVLNIEPQKVRLLYDVCHNIAKFEEHEVDSKKQKLLVHRKGATRAFGPGSSELASSYQKTGQPVLVPGDMGRASYLLVGEGNKLTFCSCCHGAGRVRSRIKSRKLWSGKNPIDHMRKQGVQLMAASTRTITEEMPDAYKNVDDVVLASQNAKLAKIIARLKPHLVIKG